MSCDQTLENKLKLINYYTVLYFDNTYSKICRIRAVRELTKCNYVFLIEYK